MRTWYWTRTCVFCNGQGRLLVTREPSRDGLFLLCEECEMTWPDTERAADLDSALPPLPEGFRAQPATWEDISRHGWGPHVAGSFKM